MIYASLGITLEHGLVGSFNTSAPEKWADNPYSMGLLLLSAGIFEYILILKYTAIIDGYFSVPTTLSEMKSNFRKFVICGHNWNLNVDYYCYSGDPRFSLLFDSHGNIAGIRTGYIKSDIPKKAISKDKEYPADFFTRKPGYNSEKIWDIDCWTLTALFADPKVLRAGGRPDPKGIVLEDLYLNQTGTFTKISKDECQAENLGFRKQACFLGMGMHYFYNMTTTTDCKDLNGMFLLYECGQLIGLGFTPFGSFTSKDRSWFEDPPVFAVKAIVPHRPSCLTEYIENFGSSSLHIFFKAWPRFTFCTWPWQKNHCGDQKTSGNSLLKVPNFY